MPCAARDVMQRMKETSHPQPARHSCCSHHSPEQEGQAPVTPATAAKYFCPMCPGVESDRPGSCPKCGMALDRNPAWRPATEYTCPMHPEIRQDHPGNCPKCGMALEPAAPAPDDEHGEDGELSDMTRRLWWTAILTLPVFISAMAHLIPAWSHAEWSGGATGRWLQFLLSTPVVFRGGGPFFVRAWQSARHRSMNMFTLIALGVGSAWLFSAAAMLVPSWFPASAGGHGGQPGVYFEAAAVIIVLVLLGQVLELRARQRTGSAVRELLRLTPPVARLVTPEGEREVPLSSVQTGDKLRVLPGGSVPVDGVIVEGRSALDESLLTGEPLPVDKNPGDPISAGTLNTHGSLVMEAGRVGADTVLSRIIHMVGEAQRSRAPVQALADRVAGWFVPAVLGVAALTFVLWLTTGPEPRLAHAITAAVAVLIIACPCALGLATPMSVMVGIGRGAQLGVLIRHAAAIEKLAALDTLIVDKTGTLTAGRPQVTRIIPAAGFTEEEVLALAAAVERHSEHPLAHAVTTAAEERSLKVPAAENVSATVAGGISGEVGSRRILVGKPDFLHAQGVGSLTDFETAAASHQAAGGTALFVAAGGEPAGVIIVTDPVKPSTPAALTELRELKINVVMMTGDHPRTAEHVARELNITTWQGGVSPEDKHARVMAFQGEGRITGMAGDGINDAPALAAADVGIAMGTGADAAMESAAVTLVKGDLRGIVRAVRLGRAMMGNIRQNLMFAFLYNALGIPVAAGALYPVFGWLLSPMLAGVAMSVSSVSVILNALRLRNFGGGEASASAAIPRDGRPQAPADHHS